MCSRRYLGFMTGENCHSNNALRVPEHAASQKDLVGAQGQCSAVQQQIPCESIKAAVWQLAIDLDLGTAHISLQMHRS